ncbi:transmembrane prolyl 4-hydroxylase-like [Nematostella vectensis]|uniref:transmembrane prolyl 4-hydroxylase-like n=1 Tax=Nematostella vectensis TaxID=45351 RepID=UPI002076FFB2|nr:transmembrane prolyl 4-hydroxylase-like [Nematostella vectensis]
MDAALCLRIILLGICIHHVSCDGVGEKVDKKEKCSSDKEGCPVAGKVGKDGRIKLSLPIINGVEVGHEEEVELIQGRRHRMKTLSLAPPVYEIQDLFSDEECDFVVELATNKGLQDSPLMRDPREVSGETTRDTFNEWDTNSDGFIDIDEFLYLPGKSDLYLTDEDVKKMFSTLDIDHDNNDKMSFEEFSVVTAADIKKYFDQLRKYKSRLLSRNSQQTWLWHDEDELMKYEDLLEDYHDRFAKLTKLPRKIIEHSEPLQVVRYEEHGHYHCHHDSEVINKNITCCTYGAKDCRLCRFLTVLIFLNDVEAGGELAFPVADNKTFTWESWTKESKKKCNLAKHCSDSNLVITPKKGKAIMFYNHLVDPKSRWMSALDPRSFHGGCDVKKGTKWVANVWINVIGDGMNELKSWKMNSNWLSKNNINQEVVSALQTTENIDTDLEEAENRYTEEKNVKNEEAQEEDRTLNSPPERIGEEVHVEEMNDEFVTQSEGTEGPPPLPTEGEQIKGPQGPKVKLSVTPAPLPLPLEQLTPKEPKGPKVTTPPKPKEESGDRILRSVMLLIDELDQVELEIVARNLHTRLKLVCVPLIMNPMGSI